MRLLLAIADKNLRLALELLLSEQPNLEIVGTTNDLAGLRGLLHTSNPDVVVIGSELFNGDLKEIKKESEKAQFISRWQAANDGR